MNDKEPKQPEAPISDQNPDMFSWERPDRGPVWVGDVAPQEVAALQERSYSLLKDTYEEWVAMDIAKTRGEKVDAERLRTAQERLTSLIQAHQFGQPNQE